MENNLIDLTIDDPPQPPNPTTIQSFIEQITSNLFRLSERVYNSNVPENIKTATTNFADVVSNIVTNYSEETNNYLLRDLDQIPNQLPLEEQIQNVLPPDQLQILIDQLQIPQEQIPQVNDAAPDPIEISSDDDADDNDRCVMCYHNMADVATLTTIHRQHTFHTDCIQRWWTTQLTNYQERTCPICRLPPDEDIGNAGANTGNVDRFRFFLDSDSEDDFDLDAPDPDEERRQERLTQNRTQLINRFRAFIERTRYNNRNDARQNRPEEPYFFEGDTHLANWIVKTTHTRTTIRPQHPNRNHRHNRFEAVRVSLENLRREFYANRDFGSAVSGVVTDNLYATVDPLHNMFTRNLSYGARISVYIAVDLSLSMQTNQYPNPTDNVISFMRRLRIFGRLYDLIGENKQEYLSYQKSVFLEVICSFVEDNFESYNNN